MRVTYSTDKNGTYEEKSVDFCCDEMKEAYGERDIIFGESDTLFNQNKDVNIRTCDVYPEGAFWGECSISFCPFCGVTIKVEGAK